MRFKIDENLPLEIALLLNSEGHDATTVLEEGLGGTEDPGIVAICKEEGRALVTLDMDFSDIRLYPPGHMPGTIVIRLNTQSKKAVLSVVSRIMPDVAETG